MRWRYEVSEMKWNDDGDEYDADVGGDGNDGGDVTPFWCCC